ncbi:MAG: type VII toxin-antitoxin system MntA family adenylyltransferase antitoxin [bacterium]
MVPSKDLETLIPQLRETLLSFDEVSFAVLFGSAVQGRLRDDSDLDIAVYVDAGGALEIEVEREVPSEAEVQVALERATGRNVDLLVLNRAPATVCSAALLTGRSVVNRTEQLYARYFLAVTSVAIDFLATEREFREIASRSTSLTEIDRRRLERIIEYLDEEMSDRSKFEAVSLSRYRNDRDLRRNLDRWVEMLINAAIDIGKIVLSSEHKSVPRTYGQILEDLECTPPFDELHGRLKPLAPLRNMMAHEYLDLRFKRVQTFVTEGADAVADLARVTRAWME